ncbi:PREDICTED: uncharacterized protein LOC108772091 [Cyphomyrmex costatus]|uniref:uncharacterized protein LOC108772091 n=1 Tax=Cyphomyrmex costatus TaxID=456900 RepID=UPI00085240D7|nr:PREDICTED: uncharacterized protein LOC108772091 [Cyphomyrmex costatus]
MISPTITPQLMTTAMISVQDHKGKLIKCRALLDTCATANFISHNLARCLRLPITSCALPISAINSTNTMTKGVLRVIIRSLDNKFNKELVCLTIPTIADLVPSEKFPRNSIKIPSNIELTDPSFHLPRRVELLIGAGATLSLFSSGQISLTNEDGQLYLQNTRLGWIVARGGFPDRPKNITCSLTTLDQLITRFWNIEEITGSAPRSIEEVNCETHFTENVTRNDNGRYVVRLPFRKDHKQLGESRNAALKRLYSLERKLSSNLELKTAYSQIIQEYLKLKQMIPIDDSSEDGYYMPHHAVIKPSSNTTKVRVVFDASAKTSNGLSLNDVLLTGPIIQNPLFAHLLRFRTYKYVLSADIEKMYRQVLLHESDRMYQRILWRQDNEVKTFQLNTLTFGVSSSPYLAIRVIQQLADDERVNYPEAARVLTKHLYVDDLLTGANTIEDARTLRNEIIALLSRGGFNIRQWASNERQIIDDLDPEAINAGLTLDRNHPLKTLGLTWHASDDVLCYSVRSVKQTEKITKREVVSKLASIYDPLGIVGPVILYGKKLMQDLWLHKIGWDDTIPPAIQAAWSVFEVQLESISEFSVERSVLFPGYSNIQIHGFCDASKTGYGACLYIRSNDRHDNIYCRLLCAKSRVAPLKTVSIPRLELCGALLLARLYREIHDVIELPIDRVVLWSDSTIVLHWVKMQPHLLKTYVSHRVAQIQEMTDAQAWRHVSSNDNPADALSRGQLPNASLNNRTWNSGPPWLSKRENEWPSGIAELDEIPERRKNTCLNIVVNDCDILRKYSSYSQMCRIIAWSLRFRPKNTYRNELCMKEISDAEIRIIKIVQASRFLPELKRLANKQPISKNNIAALNPFIDEDSLIRVGGRLKDSNLTFEQKHPILLPNRHFVTDSIIKETHERRYHAGIQMTLYAVRQRFWILDGML